MRFSWLGVTAVMAAVLFTSPVARAQAWVPEEQALSVGASYTFAPSDHIIESDGLELDDAVTKSHVISLDIEYATPVPRLAVDVSLPVVGAKWDDSSTPHGPIAGPWDDGSTHFTVTDLRVGARYQLLTAPFAMSVALAGSLPTHSYPVIGYTAPGRNLKALHAGVHVGHMLASVPLYGLFSYEFSFVESFKSEFPDTEEWGQNRSDVSASLGYLLGESFDIHLGLNTRFTHGGLNFVDFGDAPTGSQNYHDGILNEDILLFGGGIGYAATDKLSLGVEFRAFLWGQNTRVANLYTLGASYSIF